MTVGERASISIPFARQRPSKSFDSCASFMTAIVATNFDWSIESCDKAPHDLNYERNTEKYGHAMKLTIWQHYSMVVFKFKSDFMNLFKKSMKSFANYHRIWTCSTLYLIFKRNSD